MADKHTFEALDEIQGELKKKETLAKLGGKPKKDAKEPDEHTKIGLEMQALQQKGRELMKAGRQDSMEYGALIEKHRQLRGRQRFLEENK
jgi:hypothetical protein